LALRRFSLSIFLSAFCSRGFDAPFVAAEIKAIPGSRSRRAGRVIAIDAGVFMFERSPEPFYKDVFEARPLWFMLISDLVSMSRLAAWSS
jgi:hypothetical protein